MPLGRMDIEAAEDYADEQYPAPARNGRNGRSGSGSSGSTRKGKERAQEGGEVMFALGDDDDEHR